MPSRLLLLLFCVGYASAQDGQLRQFIGGSQLGSVPNPNPNAKRYPISGTVYNTVTNEPIPRALVRVNSGQGQQVAFTGSDGRFQLANIPEGSVWISAQRPGFFEGQNGPGVHFSNGNGGYPVGSGSNDFKVPLTPEAKLSGAVLDVDGEPVEGVEVQLAAEQIMQGRKQWMNRGGTTTDENGFYLIDGQMPGSVVVCTAVKPLLPTANNGESYPRRCYPNSPDPLSAQPIAMLPGQTARADFSLELVRTFSVSGVVMGAAGPATGIWIEGAGNQQTYVNNFRINPTTGQFIIRSVPNGTWRFHFESNNGRSAMTEAVAEITVGGSDVRGVQVTLQPGVDIPVEVVGASRPAEPASGGEAGTSAASHNFLLQQVHLSAIDGGPNRQYYSQQLPNPNEGNSAPRLAFEGVPAGTYSVSAQSAGNGCVGSISYGGTDVSHEPLTIAAGASAQPLVVNLRSDCATLTVTMQSDTKDANGMVLTVPDSGPAESLLTGLQANSTATLSGLTPGSYHVYAVTDANEVEYTNPQAMRDVPSESVTLEPNGKATVTVQLAERGKR